MKLETTDLKLVQKGTDYYLGFIIPNKHLDKIKKLCEVDKVKTIEIKQKRESRSISANAYSWILVDKLAKMMNVPKGDIYIKMVKRYGQCSQLAVIPEALNEHMKIWDNLNTEVEHTENMCEVIGNHRAGSKKYIELNCYFGTSNKDAYDSKKFSQYVNGIVSECELVGIETMSPNEIESMMSNYKGV